MFVYAVSCYFKKLTLTDLNFYLFIFCKHPALFSRQCSSIMRMRGPRRCLGNSDVESIVQLNRLMKRPAKLAVKTRWVLKMQTVVYITDLA